MESCYLLLTGRCKQCNCATIFSSQITPQIWLDNQTQGYHFCQSLNITKLILCSLTVMAVSHPGLVSFRIYFVAIKNVFYSYTCYSRCRPGSVMVKQHSRVLLDTVTGYAPGALLLPIGNSKYMETATACLSLNGRVFPISSRFWWRHQIWNSWRKFPLLENRILKPSWKFLVLKFRIHFTLTS